MQVRLAALVVLALLAGCSTLGTTDQTPTVTPAPVPGAAETTEANPLPPGVTGANVTDPQRLASAHRRATTGRSYTWHDEFAAVRFLTNDTLNNTIRSEARVQNESRYTYWTNRREAEDDQPFSYLGNYTAYVTGDVGYVRYADDGRIVYETQPPVPAARQIDAADAIRRYLAVRNANVAVTRVDGERYYEITGTEYVLPTAWVIENYSVRAVVSPDGFVRTLDVSYVRTQGTERERIDYSYRYTRVGTTTVSEPGWVSDRWDTDSRDPLLVGE